MQIINTLNTYNYSQPRRRMANVKGSDIPFISSLLMVEKRMRSIEMYSALVGDRKGIQPQKLHTN